MKNTIIIKILSIKILSIIVGLFLLLRLYFIASGLPVSILSQQPLTKNQLNTTISLNPQHAYAYGELAQKHLDENNLNAAKIYAYQSLQNNLSSGKAISQLLTTYNKEDRQVLADQAALFTAKLWPAHTFSMETISRHWLSRNQPDRAVPAWNTILNQNYDKNTTAISATEEAIFAIFEKLALQENSESIFEPYHANPPIWWMHYFRYLVNSENNLKAVTDFYKQELAYKNIFPAEQRQLYLTRLGKDHKLKEAYYLWLSSLKEGELKQSNLIYNGGFEGDILNREFSWNFGKMTNVRLYKDSLSHHEGEYSLHVAFNTWVANYLGYLHQVLILSPGKYTVKFHTRGQLFAQQGLVWKLHCINDFTYLNGSLGKHIATSSTFKGSLKWEEKAFTFTIPNESECPAQGLFLDTTSGVEERRRVRGDIWFDNFTITPN